MAGPSCSRASTAGLGERLAGAGRDADAAAAVAAGLAEREARRSAAAALAARDAESLRCLRVRFQGGSGGLPLAKDQAIDLRFLGDRVMVCPRRSASAVAMVPYRDVAALEVSGPAPGRSSGELAVLILAVGLLGALLGLLLSACRACWREPRDSARRPWR